MYQDISTADLIERFEALVQQINLLAANAGLCDADMMRRLRYIAAELAQREERGETLMLFEERATAADFTELSLVIPSHLTNIAFARLTRLTHRAHLN